MRRLLIFAIVMVSGCARRTVPVWATAPAKQPGDPTVTGEPAKIGKLAGANAVYRMLMWNDGVFEIEFKAVSRADVASSNKRMGAFFNIARAMAIR